MGELSEDSESSAGVNAADGGEGGSESQDRPKLVALPGPVAAPDQARPGHDAAPAADDAERAADDAERAADD
ncbi:MAG: hypothetical protein WAL22_23355, partial [Solirubrobacteraceae bacterium]